MLDGCAISQCYVNIHSQCNVKTAGDTLNMKLLSLGALHRLIYLLKGHTRYLAISFQIFFYNVMTFVIKLNKIL